MSKQANTPKPPKASDRKSAKPSATAAHAHSLRKARNRLAFAEQVLADAQKRVAERRAELAAAEKAAHDAAKANMNNILEA